MMYGVLGFFFVFFFLFFSLSGEGGKYEKEDYSK